MAGWRGMGLLAGVAVALAGGCGRRAERSATADAAPKPVVVTVADAVVRPVERVVDAVGTFKGWDEVTVGARKAGRVVRVHHDIGDRVKPGELLVECERDEAELSVSQAEKQLLSDLARLGLNTMTTLPAKLPDLGGLDINALPSVVEASVALDRAKQNLGRERNLVGRSAGTQQDLQNAENDVRAAEARLAGAILAARSTVSVALGSKVMLDLRRQALRDLEIHAPKPSRQPEGLKAPLAYAVSKRQASEGQMIREGDAVYDLAIENPLRLYLNVPERFAAAVRPGQAVRIRVGSYPDEVFGGTVRRINPTVATDSRSFQVEVGVANDESKLRPGGFAKAEIVTESDAKATLVPLDAVVRFAGVTKLFTVGGDNKAHAIEVETGREEPGWVEVRTPLPGGAKVVVTGHSRLADGTSVAIRAPDAPGTETKTANAQAGKGS